MRLYHVFAALARMCRSRLLGMRSDRILAQDAARGSIVSASHRIGKDTRIFTRYVFRHVIRTRRNAGRTEGEAFELSSFFAKNAKNYL